MARGIKVVDYLIPNNEELKIADTDYIQHTENDVTKTQTQINKELQTLSGYYVCDTLGNVNAKTVTATNYKLTVGGSIKIKFDHAHILSEGTVTLNINNQGAETILYAGDTVTSSNTWDDDEIVNVFYDGTNYLAYSVEGGGLLKTVDTSNPNAKKGLTEEAIVGVLGDVKKEQGSYVTLQDQIYEISASSSTVGIALYNDGQGSNATTRLVGDSGSTDTHKIYGTCNPSKSQMTLYRRANGAGSWESVGGPTTATNNSGENLYQYDVASDTPIRYDYFIRNHIYSTDKDTTSPLYIYYVLNTYYGALPTMTEGEDPEPIIYTLDDLIGTNGHTRQLIPSLRINSKGTYSMSFDTRAKKVYMVCPKAIVTTINPAAVYWMSVISSNIMPFTRDTSMENNDYYVYISDNTYTVDPAGSRNIIFQ